MMPGGRSEEQAAPGVPGTGRVERAADREFEDALALANAGRERPSPRGAGEPPRASGCEGPGAQREQGSPADQDRDGTPDRTARPAVHPGTDPPLPRTSAGEGARPAPAASWRTARATAARAASGPLEPVRTPLAAALGRVLCEPLTALTDLPSFDTSAMDGWAVSGPGPWRTAPRPAAEAAHEAAPAEATLKDPEAPEGPEAPVDPVDPVDPKASPDPKVSEDPTTPTTPTGILAGHAPTAPLPDGHAIRIATGARIPSGATAVLRTEHSEVREQPDGSVRLYAPAPAPPGQDIRPRGQECRSGDHLLPAGALVTPAVLGLAAAAGYDELATHRPPRVEILVLGDELLHSGLPHDGLIRDALGPMLGPWLRALGAEAAEPRHLGDDADALHGALLSCTADLVITTGGTAAGPVDHVHPTLRRMGAELLVDGVAVRPGHPMLLARLTDHRHLVGLPGNPLAAVSGLLTLAEPLLRTLCAKEQAEPCRIPLTEAVQGHPRDTRLVPVAYREDEVRGQLARPLHFHGPAMLRGIAGADALAVIPPGGTGRGQEAELLDLPWALSGWPPNSPSSNPPFPNPLSPNSPSRLAGGAA